MRDALHRHGPLLLLGAVELVLLGLAVPFVAHNNLYGHDLVGHYLAAKFTRDHLFPAVFGWNPLFYCGAAQNQLYPPLLAWLAGGLGRLIEVGLALKLLVALAVLATPPAIYAFARAAGLSRPRAAAGALVLTLYLTLNRQQLGGNFTSTIETGNLANALNLPLLFCYFASVLRLRRAEASVLLPSALLALNLVSHLVGGLIAILFLVAEAGLDRLSPGGERPPRPLRYLAHAALALALSAFFTVPLLLRLRFGSLDKISNDQYPDSLLLQLCVYAVLLAFYVKRGADRRGLSTAAMVAGALFFLHTFWFNDYWPQSITVHVHRFKLYDSLLALLLVVSLAADALERRRVLTVGAPERGRPFVSAAMAALGVGALGVAVLGIDARGVGDQPLPRLPPLDSRVMVVSAPQSQVSDHTVQHLVAADGQRVNKGLFFETAANARALADLELLLARTDRPVRLWNVMVDDGQRIATLRSRLRRLLDLFGFGHVLANEGLHPAGPWLPARDVGAGFTLYDAAPAPLAEVWKGAVDTIDSARFEDEARRWLFADLDRLVAELPDGAQLPPAPAPAALQAARVVYAGEGVGEIAVDVAADEPVPVLVKVSYFPWWRATDVGGRELPLFRVTPHFMLLYGRGPIVLRYQPLALDRALGAVSVGAWGLVLGLLVAVPLGRRRPRARLPLLAGALALALAGAAIGRTALFARPSAAGSTPGPGSPPSR